MKKIKHISLIVVACLVLSLIGCGKQETADEPATQIYDYQVYIGEIPINEYEIVYEGGGAKPAALLLSEYIKNISGVELKVSKNPSLPENRQIKVVVPKDNKDFEYHETKIKDGGITVIGDCEEEITKAAYGFINTYLGYEFAGTERERVNVSNLGILRIPENSGVDAPWMEKREPIITLWKTNSPRGVYRNENSSLKVDVMNYSEEELYSYVRMMKHLGFTGIQVTDMCSAWAGEGSIKAVHDKIRFMADAAHSMDMDFTLWVWGAEFTGYGWVDNTVTYDGGEYGAARNNPDVIACFEKYYDYYAELADVTDRLIAHFYDPGNLGDANDVAYFSGMLREKFTAINPTIDFGVSCWVDQFDKNTLVSNLGDDITLYEGMQHNHNENYAPFRQTVSALNCRLGMWEWNGCEMEIDQLAQMNYQPSILKENYQTLREYDGVLKPEYWSTMDSYHVLNVFSLYAAARLEQDPDLDVIELTDEVTRLTVGEEYADDFAEMLLLLEEARSGYTWNDFFWDNEDYLIKSDRYPYEDIIEKFDRLYPILNQMIDEGIESAGLPLPIPLTDVLRLFRSHLIQIDTYALFRRDFAGFKEAYDKGEAEPWWVEEKLMELSDPIPDFDTVVGLWGQIEQRAQRELIVEWCLAHDMEPPIIDTLDYKRKQIIYQYFVMYQEGHEEPVIQYPPYFQYGAAFNEYDTPRLVDDLVAEGILIEAEDEDGGVYLTDFDDYRLAFN